MFILLVGMLLELLGFGVLNVVVRVNFGIVELIFFICWNLIIVEFQVMLYCMFRMFVKFDMVMFILKILFGCILLEVGEIVKVGCCVDIDIIQNNKFVRRLVNILFIGVWNLGCQENGELVLC